MSRLCPTGKKKRPGSQGLNASRPHQVHTAGANHSAQGIKRGSTAAPFVFDYRCNLSAGAGAGLGEARTRVVAHPGRGRAAVIVAHAACRDFDALLEHLLTLGRVQIEALVADFLGLADGVTGKGGGGNSDDADRSGGKGERKLFHFVSPTQRVRLAFDHGVKGEGRNGVTKRPHEPLDTRTPVDGHPMLDFERSTVDREKALAIRDIERRTNGFFDPTSVYVILSLMTLAVISIAILGVFNFAMHAAVLERGHPLADQMPDFLAVLGGRLTFVAEFAVLLFALLLAANGWPEMGWAYLAYTVLNAMAAWLILRRKA